MTSLSIPRLDQTEEDAVRALHKSVSATNYEDPVDQEAFLVASARSVLHFRQQVASFAASSEIGECIFTIRAALVRNNLRLATSPDPILSSITDFAGEIVRLRQDIRDRKQAQKERAHAENGAAARAARREALDFAAKRELNKSDPDTVSIPSDDEQPIEPLHPSPLRVKPVSPPASPIPALLSPLHDLEGMMRSLRLSHPPVPLAAPLSPNLFLPDPVPRVSRPFPAYCANVRDPKPPTTNGPSFIRGRQLVCVPTAMPPPTLASNVAVLVPRPIKLMCHRPTINYVDDLPRSRTNSTAFRARTPQKQFILELQAFKHPPDAKTEV
ncbi:hypothetical protein C8R46DRAFT_1029866 [Mycena filopes]|nr:hypothetical protein C8R46DRAFT_1029866 [Mycena filopes]